MLPDKENRRCRGSPEISEQSEDMDILYIVLSCFVSGEMFAMTAVREGRLLLWTEL